MSHKETVDFAYWLSHLTEYGEQELLDFYRDHINGVQSFQCFFRHTPVRSLSFYSNEGMYVVCKGKTLEEAVRNYKRDFDKTRWKSVEFVTSVEKKNAGI
jgi:hypothetical protein